MPPHPDPSATTTIATREPGRRGAAVVPVAQPTAVRTGEAASTATLVKVALGETAELLQAQIQLAAIELREDAKVAVHVGVVFGTGAALALVALTMGAAAAAFALAQVLPAWAACLTVAAVIALAAAIVLRRGRDRLAAHRFAEQSAVAAQEGEQWIREKLS